MVHLFFSLCSLKIPFFLTFLSCLPLLLICQKSLEFVILTNLLVLWLATLIFLCFLLFLVFLWSLISTCQGHVLFEKILESFLLDAHTVNTSTERSRANAIKSELEFNAWPSFLFPYAALYWFETGQNRNDSTLWWTFSLHSSSRDHYLQFPLEIPGFCLLEDGGILSPTSQKFAHFSPPGKILPPNFYSILTKSSFLLIK